MQYKMVRGDEVMVQDLKVNATIHGFEKGKVTLIYWDANNKRYQSVVRSVRQVIKR